MSSLPIELTWQVDGKQKSEEFALLVVACDPRLINIPDRTPFEKTVHDAIESSTFYTSVFQAKRDAKSKYATRFNPAVLADNGPDATYDMCGFRDEVRAHCFDWPSFEPEHGTEHEAPGCAGGESLLTCYHLRYGPFITPNDQKEATEKLWQTSNKNLKAGTKLPWIDFQVPMKKDKDEVDYIDRLVEDYFPHFNSANLAAGLPWKVLKEQGKNNTIYVASFTCFESVVHIYNYCKLLMEQAGVRAALPKDLNAPIAVVGAGPSGILFATQFLMPRGYKNIKILEAKDFYGGKSRTVQVLAPGNNTLLIPCELGTCYLSAEYTPLLSLIDKYQAGTPINLEGQRTAPSLRSVIDPEAAQTDEEKKHGVNFQLWCLHKAATYTKGVGSGVEVVKDDGSQETRWNTMLDMTRVPMIGRQNKPVALVKVEVIIGVVASLIRYGKLHKKIMGEQKPMPFSPLEIEKINAGIKNPKEYIFTYEMTYKEFLERNELMNLLGPLTYAYSLQGYGAIDRIPAYYGLIWITPIVLSGAVFNTVWLNIPKWWQDRIKGITGFDPDANLMSLYKMERGWSELWNRIAYKENLRPLTEFKVANLKVVKRAGVPTAAAV